MTSAPPKAIKAFVTGVIKDQILESKDDDTSNTNSNTSLNNWLALLKMELVQRGVLVALKDDDVSTWEAAKTLEVVRSYIGKAILEEGGSTMPTPLLAASAVMAGRVAELCATSSSGNDSGDASHVSQLFDQAMVASALERCQEIADPRFQVLLELLLAPKPTDESNGASNNDSNQGNNKNNKNNTTALMIIAEGYFLRGAQFQPDTPQIWKKANDVIVAQQQPQLSASTADDDDTVSPGNAAVVLTNMARIATAKGNHQRATELTAKSVEAYLQLATAITATATPSKAEEAFVIPYRPPTKNPLDKAESALEVCEEHLDVLSPAQVFVVDLLRVKLQLAQEDKTIEQESQHAHQQAINRGGADQAKPIKGSTLTTKPPSLAVLRTTTRNRILVQSSQESEDAFVSAAVKLRDATLERLGSSDDNNATATNMRTLSAATTLQRVLERQRDRAKALACCQSSKKGSSSKVDENGWTALGAFLGAFWTFTNTAITAAGSVESWFQGLPKEILELVETYASNVPSVEWMVCSSSKDNSNSKDGIIPQEYLRLVLQTLEELVKHAVQAKKEYQAASNVLKTSTEPMDVKIRQLECARASVQSLLLMRQSDVGAAAGKATKAKNAANDDLKRHSELAVKMAQRTDQRYHANSIEYGTGYWNFLLAWSGLQQSCWSFCTAPEARMVCKHALHCLTLAKRDWGRPISTLEQLLLDLASADAECGILSGGLPSAATKLYHAVLERVESPESSQLLDETLRSLIKSHCLVGLTRLALFGNSSKTAGEDSIPADLALKSLAELSNIAEDKELTAVYLWTSPGSALSSVKFHRTTARQLVADAFIRSGRASEAKEFLEDAVADSPADAEANFSLGAFLLRDAFHATERSVSDLNSAKMQLLKAAKLDSRKAGPFALLGVWYEDQGDRKRALGCYSKALLLDPPHPVAGRGVMRLTTFDSAKAVIDSAVHTSSAVNGWAWRALGKHKVMVTGENNLGAVALLKALRCRDIDQPQNEALSVFFAVCSASGDNTDQSLSREKGMAWSELAFCYRRLGRFTAAIRSYYSSIEAFGDIVTGSVLCACAEAELSLGLAEEAAEKFKQALDISGPTTKAIAAYGQGASLLSLARRDAQDGKAGASYGHIQQALGGFESATTSFGCAQKLLGDLYTFGATLPPGIFGDEAGTNDKGKQITFVENAEACYNSAVEYYAAVSDNTDESNLLCAAVITDTGASILLRAQLTAFSVCKGFGNVHLSTASPAPEVAALYESALTQFRRATELCPDYGPAWCGIGCSVVFSDPLLAQHAFCRSIQLDSLAPDAYGNLGFLYTAYESFEASKSVMDALTQVADSPMMWINRALMLERSAVDYATVGKGEKAVDSISQAADAYRAALQVVKHPSAMLGLAMTCRASSSKAHSSFEESYGYLLQYEGCMGSSDASASLVEGLLSLELAANGNTDESRDTVQEGRQAVEGKLEEIRTFQQDRPKSGLDLDLIQKCLSSTEIVDPSEEEKPSSDSVPPPSMTLARQITFEPQRGDLWVELAMQLFGEVGHDDESNNKSALKSAHVAASRATQILTHQLTFPNQTGSRGGSSSSSAVLVVNQKNLSEALSLEYWLEILLAPAAADGSGEEKGEEKESDEAKEPDEEEKEEAVEAEETSNEIESSREKKLFMALGLQKALMICPNNRFAREALDAIAQPLSK